MKKILLIFTGGTICSSKEDGKNESNAKKTGSYLVDDFRRSDSPFRRKVLFSKIALSQDILSENMTVGSWNELLRIFQSRGIWRKYEGVIVLHGTDMLAYTASLLSILLSGAPIPICLVSSQLPLKKEIDVIQEEMTEKLAIKDPRSNGYANFRAAVELIMNGIAPNVYAVYQNVEKDGYTPKDFLVHLGSRLLQCPNYSNNFHSRGEMRIPDPSNAKLEGRVFEYDCHLWKRVKRLSGDVLLVEPYVSLCYDAFRLKGFHAVIHGTNHSESVCVGRAKNLEIQREYPILTLEHLKKEDRPFSILSFLKRCEKKGIPVFLAPCNEDSYAYGSTRDALEGGAWAIPNTTVELAYAKALVGCALGKRGRKLREFMLTPVNYEFTFRGE